MCADGQESLELFVIIFGISNVRPIVMREFFFSRLQTEFFFCFQASFCPVSEEIEPALLGMSLTTLGEVPRSVSFLESRSCENFGLAHFSIV